MKKVVFWVVMLLPFMSLCQLDISTYLLTATKDNSVITYQEQSTYLDEKPYGMPALKKVEFRTKNDEFVAQEQEYALRLSPANPGEIKANNETFKARNSLIKLKAGEVFKEKLEEKYFEVLDFTLLQEKRNAAERKVQLLKQEEAIYLAQIKSSSFDPQDLIDVKIKLIDQLSNLSTIAVEQDAFLLGIQEAMSYSTEKPNWTYIDLIDIDSIESVINDAQKSFSESIEIAIQEQEILLLTKEMKLEKAKRNIGFLQTDYIPARENKTPFAISLGVVLPIVNTNKSDITEKRLDQIEEEGKLKSVRSDVKRKDQMAYFKLNNDIKRYQDLVVNIKEASDQPYLNTLLAQEKHRPSSVLKMKQAMMKLELQLLNAKHAVYRSYIEYLSLKDVLQQEPLLNYLSPALKPIR